MEEEEEREIESREWERDLPIPLDTLPLDGGLCIRVKAPVIMVKLNYEG